MSKQGDLSSAISGVLQTGAGRRGAVRDVPVSPPTDTPAPQKTSTPATPPTVARVPASYKISERTREDMRRFAKWINRDKEPGAEIEIGQMVDDALVAYMRVNGWPPAHKEAPDA